MAMIVLSLLILLLSSILLSINCSQNQVNLVWNISATTNDNKKRLLNSVVGSAGVQKLHAILGPSGSGKTTMLNTLAGSIPAKSLKLYGNVMNGNNDKNSIFVQQEDLLFAQLTVHETLTTSGTLKALKDNKKTSQSESTVSSTVSNFINDLGLKKVRDTRVGNAKTRGISGGEKKRLSIGNELIGNADKGMSNQIIFCDEPTSGLDSYQAQKVMQLLKEVTNKGNTVIVTIHQPRASIVALFDEITLMSEGTVLYTGPADTMKDHFSRAGYICPNNVNPAEHYIDLVSIDYSSPEAEAASRERIAKLAEYFRSSNQYEQLKKALYSSVSSKKNNGLEQSSTSTGDKIIKLRPSLRTRLHNTLTTCGVLFRRAWKQVVRDKALNIARLMSSLFSSLLFGAIYFQLSDSAATIPDRLGLLQVASVNTAMLALIKATTSFVTEKLIVQRERRNGSYGMLPYFVSKLAAEVPLSAFFPCLSGIIMYKLCGLNRAPGRLLRFLGILTVESIASTALGMFIGSLAPSVESAVSIAPAVMVIFIVFGGLYVVNTPWYLSWVPKMSLIRWSYEALCINEFSGMTLKPKSANGMLSASTGEQVLESLGCAPSTGSSVVRALKYQAAIIAANYVLTLVSLLWQKPSFEKISDSVPPPLHIPSNKSTATTDSADVVNGSSSTTKSQSIIATMKPPPVF